MNVALYNNTSYRKRVTKNITLLYNYSGVRLKENTSILEPTFLLTGLENVDFNYLYCDYLKRYYFVKDIKLCVGGVWEIECFVDVLYTYKTDIYNHKAYVSRCEHQFYKVDKDKYGIFFDSKYPVRSDVTVEPVDIGTVAYNMGYYLTVNGGLQ